MPVRNSLGAALHRSHGARVCYPANDGDFPMQDETTGGGWVIEILGDGIGDRHRRFIVGITHRANAVSAIHEQLGSQIQITSITRVSKDDIQIAGVQPGKIVAL